MANRVIRDMLLIDFFIIFLCVMRYVLMCFCSSMLTGLLPPVLASVLTAISVVLAAFLTTISIALTDITTINSIVLARTGTEQEACGNG
jgi:hypothetical protein